MEQAGGRRTIHMSTKSKRLRAQTERIEADKRYALKDGVELVCSTAREQRNESVDAAVRLGVDPRKTEQLVRGVVDLPHGVGRPVRILVLAKGEGVIAAREAGAEYAGGEEWIEKIQQGWLECDRIIAAPNMMSEVGKIGRILGPRGLMPNPRLGTVTVDVAAAVQRIQKGQVQFRSDRGGIVHAPIGRTSFSAPHLCENCTALIDALKRLRPATAKGIYLRGLSLSATMGPSVRLDPTPFIHETHGA